ncbi:MAG: hypothetical protein JWN22_1566 [Nocardioides sp.]|jgi:hypothetical protein|nr:hypothetical protein [Nocardioides sp.]
MDMRRLGVVLAALTACLPLAACGDDASSGDGGPSGGLCSFALEFQGRVYAAAAPDESAKKGRELGTATPVPCDQDSDAAPTGELTIYAVVGRPPSEAVVAEPRVGLLKVSHLSEDE